MSTSVANIATKGVMMKEEPNLVSLIQSFLSRWQSHHLLTFVILLTKMAHPFLMWLSLSA
jgi:hypothetical protein